MTAAGTRTPVRTLDDATAFLYRRLGTRGARGTARAAALCAELGDPQERYRSVHVAGTAGKGSVVAFVAGLLGAHGFTVGAQMSPHAHSICERFQLGGRPVGESLLVATLVELLPGIDRVARSGHGEPTFFEVANALAWRLFADAGVDYAVVETGLGGRLDATNTITRADKVAVLTHIDLDHTEVLGDTLAAIATEKAGILPRGGHALALAPRCPTVGAAFAAAAADRRCTLELVDPSDGPAPGPLPGMPGRHQAVNAALALRVVGHLARRDGWRVDPDAVARGLGAVRLPGRFERRHRHGHPVVLDGAHNPVKLASVVSVLRDEHPGRRFVWLLALKGDRDARAALEAVAPAAAAVVATGIPAGHPPAELAAAAHHAGVPVTVAVPDPAAALDRAVELSEPGLPVVAAGSFLLVAAVGAVAPAQAAGSSSPAFHSRV